MKDANSSNFDRERIETEAADWMAQIDRGLSQKEREAFFDWLGEDPRHGETMAEDKAEWDAFDVLDEWRPIDSKLANPDLLKLPRLARAHRTWRRQALWIGGAAALLAGGFFLFQGQGDLGVADGARRLSSQSYATSYERHVLEDGSTVELNRGSQASVKYTAEARRLELISGEAHFSVVPDPDRPFIVAARDSEVVAVGTTFNVKIDSNALEVIVTEGKVRLESALPREVKRRTYPQSLTSEPSEGMELEAGFRAIRTLDEDRFAPQVFPLSTDEVAKRLAWKDDILDFNSRPLSEVVSAFNRHNHVQIVIGDEALLDEKVTGAFKPDNHKGFVSLLELSFDIQAIQQDSSTIILRRTKN